MHSFGLVIVPGSRGTAYERVQRLMLRSFPNGVDGWRPGGRFDERLPELGLTSVDDPRPDAVPVSFLPSPIPDTLVPSIFITPRGAWLWSGGTITKREQRAWAERINRLVDKYRGGHTAVVLDIHY